MRRAGNFLRNNNLENIENAKISCNFLIFNMFKKYRWGKREDPDGNGIDRAARASPLRWGKRSDVTFDGDDMIMKRTPLR